MKATVKVKKSIKFNEKCIIRKLSLKIKKLLLLSLKNQNQNQK